MTMAREASPSRKIMTRSSMVSRYPKVLRPTSVTAVPIGRQIASPMTASNKDHPTHRCQPITAIDAEHTGSSSRSPLIARSSAKSRSASVIVSGDGRAQWPFTGGPPARQIARLPARARIR